MEFVAGTQSDDIFVPTINNSTYVGGAGNDVYLITKAVQPNAVLVISDTEGSNRIQLTTGLTLATSRFAANATELTLSNGGRIQLLGAGTFIFELEGNVTDGALPFSIQAYAGFATELGVLALPTGSAIESGTPNFFVGHFVSSPRIPSFKLTGATIGTEGGTASFSVSLLYRDPGVNYSVSVALTGAGGAVAGIDFSSTLTLDAAAIASGITLSGGLLTIPPTSEVSNVTLNSSVMTDALSSEAGEGMTFTMSPTGVGAVVDWFQPSITLPILDVPAPTSMPSAGAASVVEDMPAAMAQDTVAGDSRELFTLTLMGSNLQHHE